MSGNGETKTVKKQDIRWLTILWYIHLHFIALYGTWLLITSAKWMTVLFTIFITSIGCLGVTVGAHRLWAHRSFTASKPLRIFFILAHTVAGVGPVYDWVLHHRIHHKHYGTDKDPYNHKRGFLYSHYISNLVGNSPEFDKLKMEIDMRDMELDGYVLFQKNFYWLMFGIFGILLPINAPLEYWDESMPTTLCAVGILRLAITANTAWLVNSAMLIWGTKPGEKIPCEDNSVFFVKKSFWLPYHYMLTWDWKSSEFGLYDQGVGRFFIKMCHELGLITQLRTASSEDIREALYKVATKSSTLEESLEELERVSELNAKTEKLQGRY